VRALRLCPLPPSSFVAPLYSLGLRVLDSSVLCYLFPSPLLAGPTVFDSSDSFATCFIPPVLRSSSQLYPRATLLFYLASAPSDLIRAALFLGDDVLTISCRRTSYSRIPIYIIRTTRGALHNLRHTKNNFYQSRSKFLEILEGVHTRFTTIPRLSNPSLWLSAFCLYLPADKTALYTAVDTFVSRWSMGDVFVARNRLGCGVS